MVKRQHQRPSKFATLVRGLAAFCLLTLGNSTAFADFEKTYSGRIIDAQGEPLSGTADVQVKFWDQQVDGNRLGPQFDYPTVSFSQGVFVLEILLTPSQADDVFGD